MSSSSRTRVEDVYEAQNDQRLDDLHAKIRTLRGVRACAVRGGTPRAERDARTGHDRHL
jgi:hypothetical protein